MRGAFDKLTESNKAFYTFYTLIIFSEISLTSRCEAVKRSVARGVNP